MYIKITAAAAGIPATQGISATPLKRTILIVDDDSLVTWPLIRILEKSNYNVIFVQTSHEALEQVSTSSKIDLVIMDYNLNNGMTGVQAAENIQKLNKIIPIVFITGYDDSETLSEIRKVKASGYIHKPYNVQTLLFTLESTLRFHDALNEAETLKKEMIHRIKNYFTMIVSLIGLERSNLLRVEAKTLEELKVNTEISYQEIINRIKTIEQLFIQLCKKENKDHEFMSMDLYFQEIIKALSVGPHIKFQLFWNNLHINSEVIVRVALVVNEILTNSLKYAFPQNRPGIITIKANMENNKLCLEVADDGVGFGAEKKDGLGANLIESLIQQLHGNYEILNQRGVAYMIRDLEVGEVRYNG